MTRHVALSHTPFHLLQFGIIAQQLAAKGESLTLFHEGDLLPGIPGIELAGVISLPGFTGYRGGRHQAKANARQILDHDAWLDPSTVLYGSDLKWLTNNLVYRARRPSTRRRQTTLITDGLGSYLTRRDAVKTVATGAVKSAFGLVGYGPRHRPFPRNHFGLDQHYVAAVTGFNADRIIGDLPKIPLLIPAATPPENPNGGSLVLGAPLDAHRFTAAQARSIVDQTAAQARAVTPDGIPLAYKPHHFEDDWIAQRYAEHGFVTLVDRRPAELLIREVGYARLFGAYSSTLAFGPQYATAPCEAFSVCFEEFSDGYLDQRDRDALRQVLHGFQVTFL